MVVASLLYPSLLSTDGGDVSVSGVIFIYLFISE